MKVSIITPGRFHLFDLARELEKHQVLGELYTTFPKFIAVRFGIPRAKIRSFWVHEIVWRFDRLLRRFIELPDFQFIFHDLYARHVLMRLRLNADIFVIGSSFLLPLHPKIKRTGAIAILERGSTHIEHQSEVLRNLQGKYKLSVRRAHPKIVEREVQEYWLADFISVPSLFVANTFIQRGIHPAKLIVNHYGVDIRKFQNTFRRKRGDATFDPLDQKTRLIFIGALSARKGVLDLIDLFVRSQSIRDRYTLTLVGSITLEFKKYTKAVNWSELPIETVGIVPQDSLKNYLSEVDVFVLPSYEEGLALVQLQALAARLPVIATREAGIEDIDPDKECSWIFDAGDAAQLESILQGLTDNEIASKADRTESIISSLGLTWSDYGCRALANLQHVMASKNKKAR